MAYTGCVTLVDPYYGFFEVDNRYRIYLTLLKAHENDTKLPALCSEIRFQCVHKSLTTFVVCKKAILEGVFDVEFTSCLFTDLVKNYQLGVRDIFMLDKTLKKFEKTIMTNDDQKETIKTVVLNLFEVLIKTLGKEPNSQQVCLNRIVEHLDILTPSSLNYVEIDSNKYEHFPQWSYGVHRKPKENSILFGLVLVDPQFGFFKIRDGDKAKICMIINGRNLENITNSFIIVLDYKLVTEVFNDSSVKNLQYLIIDFRDIICIHSFKKAERVGEAQPLGKYENRQEIIINRKSTICLDRGGTSTYLDLILVNKENYKGDRIFLTLPHEYTKISVLLKEGFKYALYYNGQWELRVNSTLLWAVEKVKNFMLKDTAAYFQILEVVLPFKYKNYISDQSRLDSLEVVIKNRGFVENKFKEVAKKVPEGYRTPGFETHTVQITTTDHREITVYLSNWINKQMPLGLIPEMRVKLKNIYINRTYLKVSVFTYFEILSYQPQVPFQSANLNENSEYDWGTPYYLSLGNKIPHGVMVWSKLKRCLIRDVKNINHCKNCKEPMHGPGPCRFCRSKERDINFSLTLYATDEFGIAKVIVKDRKFLRCIMDLSEPQFAVWLSAFEKAGEYEFNSFDSTIGQYTPFESGENDLKYLLTQTIEAFNKSQLDGFEIKARKFFMKKGERIGYAKWFYIDARLLTH